MRGALLRRTAGGGCPHVVCGLTSEVRRLTPGFTDPPKLPARTGAYSIPRIDVNPRSYRVFAGRPPPPASSLANQVHFYNPENRVGAVRSRFLTFRSRSHQESRLFFRRCFQSPSWY